MPIVQGVTKSTTVAKIKKKRKVGPSPAEVADSPPVEVADSPLMEVTDSLPVESTDSLPVEVTDSPPVEVTDSPPAEVTDSPPAEVTNYQGTMHAAMMERLTRLCKTGRPL
jgi:hypothetical protein